MKNKSLLLFIAVCIFFVLTATSCKGSKNEVIVFDNSQPLALAPDVQWALVTDPYAAFRTTMDWESEINSYCKKGEILQVKSCSFDSKKNNWYEFEQGWLPESVVSIYSNRMKAQSAKKELKD